jgi:hypothetical protein
MTLLLGDCLEQLKTLPSDSVDSIVTDPPYGLSFMGKKWDVSVPSVDVWRECFRVMKPGAHLLSFGGTRTYHHMAMNVELAGFEIRDQLQWIYGSGFPKSLDISKAIDKAAGVEREVIGENPSSRPNSKKAGMRGFDNRENAPEESAGIQTITAPTTDLAKKWSGWGTALKPANEPIVLARKPLIGTVAENVTEFGVGGLNIDAGRIEADWENDPSKRGFGHGFNKGTDFLEKQNCKFKNSESTWKPTLGRWPSNVLLDEVAAEAMNLQAGQDVARFFYQPKASKRERNAGLDGMPQVTARSGMGGTMPIDDDGKERDRFSVTQQNHHPTVKPIKLMSYLINLVTPPGGIVLDPFMGSGSTGVAAIKEGFQFIGCELNPEYLEIAKNRIEAVR